MTTCPCGLPTCVEPWEPGCGLGTSKEHAVVVEEIMKQHELRKYFTYAHLPEHLQPASSACAEVARLMDEEIPEGPEKDAGMRKLLEAKDCFVRAMLK